MAVWKDVEFEQMTAILRKHGFERDIKNAHYEHLSVDEYKDFAAKKAAIRAANRQINELKKKPDTEFTAEDAVLLNNQNDFLRQKITEQDKQLAELRGKLDAKFVPFEIFSEDKLQFVAAELSKINVPFIEENTTLHIPDYAEKTTATIAASYRPSKTEGIRDKIKLEIDRLVYCSKNLEDFWDLLKRRGYEIKDGKHLAVKPTFAQRFVRLKTLGDAYLPIKLEQRIANRNNYTNAVREKFQTAGEVEKSSTSKL
ncbi:MAG: hypothetical protein NC299_14205 [Lachnospiraceae bacterium]|nr:hypothetical protein [Ruminococcus sp.]MCM1276490.1 hypothetical protein [Lachnospiraceae bacterium]